MKIYTRTGDDGTTTLFGGGRVPKSSPLIDAYGTVDETNSLIGLARAHLVTHQGHERALAMLDGLQNELFLVGADLATPIESKAKVSRISSVQITRLEETIDALEVDLPELRHFVLPGGSLPASTLHVARTACRRAERLAVKAAGAQSINKEVIVYLNRLSDLLFVMARWVNAQLGIDDVIWSS